MLVPDGGQDRETPPIRPMIRLKKRPRLTTWPSVTQGGGTELNAARARKLPRLKTFAAEYRSPLCRTERHGRLFPAGRAVGRRFDAFASDRCARRRTRRPLG